MEDTLGAFINLLPEPWRDVIVAVLLLLLSLRATLFAASGVLRAAAYALDLVDGRVDGASPWKGAYGTVADFVRIIDAAVRWIDKIAAHGPAQLPVVRGAYEVGLPKSRRP